jgi:hypothetical protein
MKHERYELQSDRKLLVFETSSIGRNGKFKKIVQFTETNIKGYYNLGFGDKNKITGEIDDQIITNNGDSQKVLATVASTVYAFTEKYKGAWVYAVGSNDVRTRLYRMGITNNLIEIQKDFEVFGLCVDQWQEFCHGIDYKAFLIRRKKS